MLQINSGKPFTREPEHRNELRGILYTNLRVVRREPIETAAGRVLPVSTLRRSGALVYEVTELIEAQPRGPGVLVSHGAEPYLRDFATVVSFALSVTCTPDPDLAQRLTNGDRGVAVFDAPSKLVKRTFDGEVLCQDADAEHLTDFVTQLTPAPDDANPLARRPLVPSHRRKRRCRLAASSTCAALRALRRRTRPLCSAVRDR